MLAPLRDTERRDLTAVIEDRADRASTLIASQSPATDCHIVIGDPNQADAICDRLLHDAHRIDPKGPFGAAHARRSSPPAGRRQHEHATGNDIAPRTNTITSATPATLRPGSFTSPEYHRGRFPFPGWSPSTPFPLGGPHAPAA